MSTSSAGLYGSAFVVSNTQPPINTHVYIYAYIHTYIHITHTHTLSLSLSLTHTPHTTHHTPHTHLRVGIAHHINAQTYADPEETPYNRQKPRGPKPPRHGR
jgi:hypothetical protein